MLTVRSFHIPVEAAFWIASLVVLGFFGANLHGHVSFCIPTLLGLDGCMGCGLGHSIGLALRGDWEGAFQAHTLGIPAVGILAYRSVYLIRHSNSKS